MLGYLATFGMELTALVALVATGAWRVSYCLTAYVFVVAVGDALVLVAPGTFFQPIVWITRESTHATLRLLLAYELVAVSFERMPRARQQALRALLACLSGVAAFLWATTVSVTAPSGLYRGLALLGGATAIALILVRAFTLLYSLPLHPVARTILLALPVHLLLQAMTIGLAMEISRGSWGWALQASEASYAVVMLALAGAAWRGRTWAPFEPLAPARRAA